VSSRDLTIAGYLLIAAAAAGLQLLSRREGSRIPPLGAVFGRVMRTRSGRVGVLAAWAWLGIHFFAR
jgi:Family of unknown function (DUF6186)